MPFPGADEPDVAIFLDQKALTLALADRELPAPLRRALERALLVTPTGLLCKVHCSRAQAKRLDEWFVRAAARLTERQSPAATLICSRASRSITYALRRHGHA
jgi:hypothetical protein